MSKIRKFLSEKEEGDVIHAIQEAELKTSGEIRVHIEDKTKLDCYERAIAVFGELNMHKTDLRNGVLFYLATDDHKFSIIGDEGINEKVPDNFWNEIRDLMTNHFKEKQFAKGLTFGIEMAGKALAQFFPYQDDDQNELSNEISTN